jgi:acetyltransferase-like isoleucine patch superfamily enzyme
MIYETRTYSAPIKINMWFLQKIIGINRKAYWPVHYTSIIGHPEHILIGIDVNPGYMPGCYIQGMGGLFIGDYTLIAANVGIITKNHDVYNGIEYQTTEFPSVKIGSYSWIGMNSVILPDVELGDFTIVGAGSVVTKSFSDGYCIIGGNPARIISKLNPEKCIRGRVKHEYYGYIAKSKMPEFINNNITLNKIRNKINIYMN